MRIGVTGASGYVGGLLLEGAIRAGHTVVSLTRRPPDSTVTEWRRFQLGRGIERSTLEGLDMIVHAAWDMSITEKSDIAATNIEGTRLLVGAAAECGARLVFVSSMSAYAGTRQTYGRAKLSCEQIVSRRGGINIRLGLVYGEEPRGMYGALWRLAGLPLVPLIGRQSYQFMLDERDMVSGLLQACELDRPADTLGLAHPERVPFVLLMKDLAARRGRRFRHVPLAWQSAYAGMRLAELAGLSLPIRSDSVLGLARPAPYVPSAQVWAELGLRLRRYPMLQVTAENG